MADIVEVTYCTNCNFYRKKSMAGDEDIGICEMHSGMYMFGHDFCSYGKPRKERERHVATKTGENEVQ